MTPLERDVVELRWIDNVVELGEIGAQLDLSADTVKNTLKEAHRKILNGLGRGSSSLDSYIDSVTSRDASGEQKRASRTRVPDKESEDIASRAHELLRKTQYKIHMDNLMSVVLESLISDGSSKSKTSIEAHIGASIESARLKPMSADPSDSDPVKLVDLAIAHLRLAGHIEQPSADDNIRITPAGLEWLEEFRRLKRRVKPVSDDTVPPNEPA